MLHFLTVPLWLAESSVPWPGIEPGPREWEPRIPSCRLRGDPWGRGFLKHLMSCSSDAAENDLGVGGGWNVSVHSPFILVTQRYRTAHPRLSGLTWQCFILVSPWVDRVTRPLHVMSELGLEDPDGQSWARVWGPGAGCWLGQIISVMWPLSVRHSLIICSCPGSYLVRAESEAAGPVEA